MDSFSPSTRSSCLTDGCSASRWTSPRPAACCALSQAAHTRSSPALPCASRSRAGRGILGVHGRHHAGARRCRDRGLGRRGGAASAALGRTTSSGIWRMWPSISASRTLLGFRCAISTGSSVMRVSRQREHGLSGAHMQRGPRRHVRAGPARSRSAAPSPGSPPRSPTRPHPDRALAAVIAVHLDLVEPRRGELGSHGLREYLGVTRCDGTRAVHSEGSSSPRPAGRFGRVRRTNSNR